MISRIISFQSVQAAFFDFDGVLIDSVPLKSEAYRILFQPFGEDAVKEIESYHAAHGGVDRYRKIAHVLTKIGSDSNAEIVNKLAERFSSLTLDAAVQAPLIQGPWDLLLQLREKRVPCFIVSGTPVTDLTTIVEKRGMKQYFQEICGSPETKPEILKRILNRDGFSPSKCVFLGDAATDFHAAIEAQMIFIGIPSAEVQEY